MKEAPAEKLELHEVTYSLYNGFPTYEVTQLQRKPDAHREHSRRVKDMANYISAQAWWNQKQTLAKSGKNVTPTINNVRTQCWSITISLEKCTLDGVKDLFKKLENTEEGFSGCFSEEEGKEEREDGTHYNHAQGCIHFPKKKTGKQLKEFFEETKAHIEPAKNTAALIKYVQKEETHVSGPFKYGDWDALEAKNQNQGTRKDLQDLEAAITSGLTFTEIMNDPELNQSLDKHRTWAIDRINAFKCGKYEFEYRGFDQYGMTLSCDYIWGDSGLAKTSAIQQFFGLKNVFIVGNYANANFLLDGYSGQEVLLLDEFKGEVRFKELLQMMQGAPYKCNVKGGYVWAAWRKVIIVSSVSPLQCYTKLEGGDGRRRQFWRRLSEGIVVHANDQPLANFYLYDSPEDAFLGKTKMKKGIKGYGPEYWARQRTNLPTEQNFEYADVTYGLTARQLSEIGYAPEVDYNDEDDDEEW